MSTLAYQLSEVASRWVPDHAYVNFDDTDWTYWEATWSTPDAIVEVTVHGSDFTLSARWTKVTLQYTGLARISAVMDLLLPLAAGEVSA